MMARDINTFVKCTSASYFILSSWSAVLVLCVLTYVSLQVKSLFGTHETIVGLQSYNIYKAITREL